MTDYERWIWRIVNDAGSRERREADAFVDRNKQDLDKAKVSIN